MERMPSIREFGLRRTPENAPEILRTPEEGPIVHPYRVMLYNFLEGDWIDLGEGFDFDSKKDALAKRDELNSRFGSEFPSFDHYGVIEMDATGFRGREIECPNKVH